MSIYDFNVIDVHGNKVSLKDYEGKVLLVVNTATHCGLTPQYKGLQELYDAYKEQGFVVLDFPCNQFGKQAPGTEEEIESFCQLNYGTTFPRFSKIEVNGENAHPLFTFLKNESSSTELQWNFTKFLVDVNGSVVERFEPTVTPKEIDAKVKELL